MTPAVAEAAFAEASREARVLASRAADAVQEGVHAARRTYAIAQRRAEDAADDAAHYIRKQPLTSVGLALGAGLVIGVTGAFIAHAISGRSADRQT